jgi:hypothetical protein
MPSEQAGGKQQHRGGRRQLRRDFQVDCEDGCVFTSIFSQTRGSASAAEPPVCSSPSLSSLLDNAAATLLLVPERLRFGTGPHELAPLLLALGARARFFSFFFFAAGLHLC